MTSINKVLNVRSVLLAAAVSAVWVLQSRIYHYRLGDQFFLGLNVFAFVMWTAGLYTLQYIYSKVLKKEPLFRACLVYWTVLIVMEWVGYNLLKIQLASNYSGLFGMNLLHVPTFAKVYYLAAGPGFLLLYDLLFGKKKL